MVSQLSFSNSFGQMKHFLYGSIKECCEKGELSVTQKMGIISILPKGNKPREYLKKKLASYLLAKRHI